MTGFIDTEDIDAEQYVKENRQQIIRLIRQSDDEFTRACAWLLLDRHTPDMDVEDLHQELDRVLEGERVT